MNSKKGHSSQIIAKIKEDNIKPTPKWQCNLVNWSFWLAVGAAIFFSSIFFSFLLINILEIPLEIFRYLHLGRYLRILFQVVPYVWLILVLVSMILGLVAFQKTKHGYRYKFIVVVSVAMTLVFMLGFIFRQNHVGDPIKELAENRMPAHLRGRPFNKAQSEALVEEGLLAGEIVVIGNEELDIKNPLKENWRILITKNTKIQDREGLNIGDKIFIVGERIGDFVFQAFSIRKAGEPWGRPIILEEEIRIDDIGDIPMMDSELMGEQLHHE